MSRSGVMVYKDTSPPSMAELDWSLDDALGRRDNVIHGDKPELIHVHIGMPLKAMAGGFSLNTPNVKSALFASQH